MSLSLVLRVGFVAAAKPFFSFWARDTIEASMDGLPLAYCTMAQLIIQWLLMSMVPPSDLTSFRRTDSLETSSAWTSEVLIIVHKLPITSGRWQMQTHRRRRRSNWWHRGDSKKSIRTVIVIYQTLILLLPGFVCEDRSTENRREDNSPQSGWNHLELNRTSIHAALTLANLEPSPWQGMWPWWTSSTWLRTYDMQVSTGHQIKFLMRICPWKQFSLIVSGVFDSLSLHPVHSHSIRELALYKSTQVEDVTKNRRSIIYIYMIENCSDPSVLQQLYFNIPMADSIQQCRSRTQSLYIYIYIHITSWNVDWHIMHRTSQPSLENQPFSSFWAPAAAFPLLGSPAWNLIAVICGWWI